MNEEQSVAVPVQVPYYTSLPLPLPCDWTDCSDVTARCRLFRCHLHASFTII